MGFADSSWFQINVFTNASNSYLKQYQYYGPMHATAFEVVLLPIKIVCVTIEITCGYFAISVT
jgi:hypothetical protein